jgi:hypothetical protein
MHDTPGLLAPAPGGVDSPAAPAPGNAELISQRRLVRPASSLSHPFTLSPYHPAHPGLPPFGRQTRRHHPLTVSPYHPLTRSPTHPLTLSLTGNRRTAPAAATCTMEFSSDIKRVSCGIVDVSPMTPSVVAAWARRR